MRTIADFTTRLRASLPRDTREELVQLATRDTINQFMRDSRAFLEEFHAPITRCGPDPEFMIEMPDCRVMVEMRALWAAPDGCTTGRRNARWRKLDRAVSEYAPGWWVLEHGLANVALRVNEWHGRAEMMAVEYAFTIARDGCEVPDRIYEEWFDAIKAGVRQRIFGDPDSSSYNPRMAELEGSKFDAGVAEAKIRSGLNFGGGFTLSPQSVYDGMLGG